MALLVLLRFCPPGPEARNASQRHSAKIFSSAHWRIAAARPAAPREESFVFDMGVPPISIAGELPQENTAAVMDRWPVTCRMSGPSGGVFAHRDVNIASVCFYF